MLTVQLDSPPKEYLVLHYRDVRLESSPAKRAMTSTREWRHDEVRLLRAKGRAEFEHSILFNDGTELRLRFADFDFAVLKPVAAHAEPRNGNGSVKRRRAAMGKP